MPDDTFLRHYHRFIGLDPGRFASGETVFACPQRAVPLCFSSYFPLLATSHRDRVILSVDPAHEKRVRDWFRAIDLDALDDGLLGEMDDCFHEFLPMRQPWRMVRLTVLEGALVVPPSIDRVEVVTEVHREVWLTKMKRRGKLMRRSVWNRDRKLREAGRRFVIVEDGEVAADAFVSDIDHGGGNLAVGTSEKHRRKGYGAAVVAAAARWCFAHDIVPIYWSQTSNEPSVHLAGSLGFERRHEELCIRVMR